MAAPTILLTGGTGFLGGAVAVELLREHPGCRLLLLVRAPTPGQALVRLRQSLARFAFLEPAHGRCDILCADLTDPVTWTDPRLDEVTHVLHLAANTSFRSVGGVRHTNILGTLALAHRMRRVAALERFVYVSTAYLCGTDPPPLVQEDDYPRRGVRHLVEYTASKAECEMLLEQTAPELPLVIARPSVVVGHTKLGCLPSASIFWYYRTLYLLSRLPGPLPARKDIVPVDYTAKALALLLLKPTLRYRRYHISAGEAAGTSWQEMMEAFARCHPERRQEPLRVVDFATVVQERDRLSQRLGPGDEERLLQALELYFRFGSSGVELFDNHRLLEEGLPVPPGFPSYLPICATRPRDRSVYEQMRDDA
jgi:nucleoside-diphosphate-sugar epimerase